VRVVGAGDDFLRTIAVMFETRHIDGRPHLLELHDTDAGSFVVLAPDRGGMVTRFRVGDTEVFYLDEVSFANPPASVRGGVPTLFPSPGKLTADTWRREGREGKLRRHGFARDLPWTVVRTDTNGAASATLRLHSGEATRQDYPFNFELDYTYSLQGSALTIEQRVENAGHHPMPFAAGLHPYFHVREAEKADCVIDTPATHAWDNVNRQEIEFSQIDLTAPEVDLHLHDQNSPTAKIAWAGKTVTITCSDDMTRWVVWTLGGWDFVCLEPWTSPQDALNTGERLIVLAPGEVRSLTTRFELTR
jgi:galactose mutarotase-like enzyme